jgi:predicted RNA-binding Zn ribbon-like protein
MTHSALTITQLRQVGGALALDFVNTADRTDDTLLTEWLHAYDDLLDWAQAKELLSADLADHLRVQAEVHPEAAARVAADARALREAIFRLFAGHDHDAPLAILNAALAESQRWLRVAVQGDRYVWHWAGDRDALDRPLWMIARAAALLLLGEEARRVRRCAADDCGWLFLDTSKNGSRRWCDMEDCGNRAKARRHYARLAGWG